MTHDVVQTHSCIDTDSELISSGTSSRDWWWQSKRQRCIGPRNNHPFLHLLHVSTCMRVPLFAVHYIINLVYFVLNIKI